MAYTPREHVAGAARQPAPHGLFSVLTFRPGAGRWGTGGASWDALPCDPISGLSILCDPETPLPERADTGDCVLGDAEPFTVTAQYGGSVLNADRAQLVTDWLTAREEYAVERTLWTGEFGNWPRLAVPETVPEGVEQESTVVVEGTAVAACEGVGALEQFLADTYGSLGVLHMTRTAATCLLAADVLDVRNNRLVTALGTPVVAGSGYPGTGPDGAQAAAGGFWVYATPALFGQRGDVSIHEATDVSNNRHLVIAERDYLLGFDPCGVGAAIVNPTL